MNTTKLRAVSERVSEIISSGTPRKMNVLSVIDRTTLELIVLSSLAYAHGESEESVNKLIEVHKPLS